jgi:hypothetical protein
MTNTAATAPQVAYIKTLRAERGLAPLTDEQWAIVNKAAASAAITALKAMPKAAPVKADTPEVAPLTPGVYEVEGTVYVVKPNRDKTRLYAKRLVEINGERLTVEGEHVAIEFEYAPGAIYNIKPEHKMPVERAKKLTIRYGKCIVCNRKLKAAKSVEDGIGPVCIKSFA